MWKGEPLSYWHGIEERSEKKPVLTTSLRFQLCKMALFVLGISERELYSRYDEWDRAQMLATYQAAEIDIPWLQTTFPYVAQTGKG